jgi:adenylate cyclase class 2
MQPQQNHGKANHTREVEVKLRVANAEQAAATLAREGFEVIQPRAFEANEVFDTPERVLRAERRLLRLREFAGAAIFTYKGTPETGRHKSREELETDVSDPESMRQILDRLGYTLFFRYEKYRTIYQRPGETSGLAVLDETPIGVWMELEGEPEWIDATAVRLGFSEKDYITESYGALWLAHCKEQRIDAPHMVFATH